MSGLALVAKALGATVTGSDRATTGPYVERLQAADGSWGPCRRASGRPRMSVVSSAIPPENPERAVGSERGQAELHRATCSGS